LAWRTPITICAQPVGGFGGKRLLARLKLKPMTIVEAGHRENRLTRRSGHAGAGEPIMRQFMTRVKAWRMNTHRAAGSECLGLHEARRDMDRRHTVDGVIRRQIARRTLDRAR
jgi:hypothetical protein